MIKLTGKTKAISLQLTEAQYLWLENAAQFIKCHTGHHVSHSAIMLRLMEKGLPHLENDLLQLGLSNERQRPLLSLAYSRRDKS